MEKLKSLCELADFESLCNSVGARLSSCANAISGLANQPFLLPKTSSLPVAGLDIYEAEAILYGLSQESHGLQVWHFAWRINMICYNHAPKHAAKQPECHILLLA